MIKHRKKVLSIMTAFTLLLTAVALAPLPVLAETPVDITGYLDLLDYDNAADLAEYISDEIGNRLAGTVRRDMTADWIVDTLESYGYVKGKDLDVHNFELTNNSWTKVHVLSGFFEVGDKKYIYHGPAYNANSVYQYRSETPVAFDGVTVLNWPDVSVPFQVPDEADYTGKAVIVTLGTGPAETKSRGATPAPLATDYYSAALALQNAHAAAVVFRTHQPRADGASTSAKIGNTASGTAITIPVGTILWHETHEAVDALAAASAPVKLSMKDIDYGMNIIATIPSATGSQKTVYLSSHFDSQVSTPGMNDNGSGTVLMLEMARAFKDVKFDYNIALVFFDSEDSNAMCGSRTYVQRYLTEEDKANFVANYNVDMISTNQPDCVHMFLNISDTRLKDLEKNIGDNERLIDYPGAVEVAQEFDIFNHNYAAALYLGFDMTKFNICYDTTTDHINFYREATREGNNYPNMLNAVEYDWRVNEKGTSFETLYHQVGDTYAANFSQERLRQIGDMMAVAMYYTAIAAPEFAPVTVTFDVNGGDALSENTKQVATNAPYGTLPVPTRDGNTFEGWYTSATGGVKITAGSPVTDEAAHTLYARWASVSTCVPSVTTPKIVATRAAYLNISASGEGIDGKELYAYLDVGDQLLYKTPLTDGKARMAIPAAPAAGDYRVVVAGDGVEGDCALTVVPYDTGVWTARAYAEGGLLRIEFNEAVSSKTGFVKAVSIGGVAYDAVADGKILKVNVPYDSLAGGAAIKISGVRFEELFPSYTFTFTVIK